MRACVKARSGKGGWSAAELAGRGESPAVRSGVGGRPPKRQPRRSLRRVLLAEAYGQPPAAQIKPPICFLDADILVGIE